MEHSSSFNTAEILGVAAASAAALGGVIVALGRSQAASAREKAVDIEIAPVSQAALQRAERGRELARSAAAFVASAYPGVRENAAGLVQRAAVTARPQASRVSSGAATTVEQARSTGATVIERLQEEILPAASAAIGGLVKQADEARLRSQPAAASARTVKTVAVEKADVALAKSTSAARESLATVAWAAAATAVIYFLLLSPERREQLRAFLWGVFDQAQVLVRDFQGYEDDF